MKKYYFLIKEKLLFLNYLPYLSYLILIFTMLTISFYFRVSLYSSGILIAVGFTIWLVNFLHSYNDFKSYLLIILPPLMYFLIHLFNIIIIKAPFIILEKRLFFALLPIVGLPVFTYCNEKSRCKIVITCYIIGIFIITSILIINFIIRALGEYSGDTKLLLWFEQNHFKYTSIGFSIFEHPTYLSMKTTWALLLSMYFFYKKKYKLFLVVVFIIFSVAIFLLASKAGIIMWLILLLSSLVFYIGRKISSNLFKYFTIAAISVTLISISFEIAKEISRINIFINQIKSGISQENVDWKNLDQRTREWYCAFQLIKEKPLFGHGIGRVEDRMVEEYLKNGWEEEARLRLNAHNQFLETQMTFGIPGTLILLWMLFTPLIFRKRLQYPDLATAFVFMMTFFLMFESMFVRQWGIMFFTLFYCILVIPPANKNS